MAALWSDVTRRNSPLSTSTYFRGPQAPVGRTQHKVPGENPRTTTSSLDLGFKGTKRSGGRMEGGQRTRCPLPNLLRPVVTRLEGEGGGRDTKRLILPELVSSPRTLNLNTKDGWMSDQTTDSRRMRTASMMATSWQVRVVCRGHAGLTDDGCRVIKSPRSEQGRGRRAARKGRPNEGAT